MATNPLVSVIVPVYKVEPYLRRCLDSVVGQTYQNLEIILVDDGSPDKCPEICDEYAAKDSRIIVIHKENGGLSDARNAGLDIAKGEYISFIDSDDWVADTYIEALWKALEFHHADLAVGNYVQTTQNYKLCISDFSVENCEVLTPVQAVKKLWTPDLIAFVTAWGKLAKASLYQDIRFPKGLIHEDEYTTYKVLYRSSSTVFVDLPLYCYLQRKDSIIGRIVPGSVRALHAKVERYFFFKEHHENELAKICFDGLCWQLLSAYVQGQNGALPQGFSDTDEIVRLFRACQKDHWESRAPLSQRLRLRALAVCPSLYPPYLKARNAIKQAR